MPDRLHPRRNHLLAALPADAWGRFEPELEQIDLPLGRVLREHGARDHVYFPVTALVSLVNDLENGETAEIAVIGNDGIVGVASVMGGESTLTRAVVQCAGVGYRLPTRVIQAEFLHPPIAQLLLRYTQALFVQVAQTAICNRHHSLDQQLCRWLLLSMDRVRGVELVMTQDLIANMLGVRRESVTDAAQKLLAAGLIRYQRGHISILDRPGIERLSCECWRVVKQEYERLLPDVVTA
jgi:CRP-like cAMP-binding protein